MNTLVTQTERIALAKKRFEYAMQTTPFIYRIPNIRWYSREEKTKEFYDFLCYLKEILGVGDNYCDSFCDVCVFKKIQVRGATRRLDNLIKSTQKALKI